jgi:galactokinase
VGGNHTDHQHGRVLAAAVNLDSVGVAGINERNVICIHSDGYRPVEIDLADLEPRAEEQYTSQAMVRGVCMNLRQNGYLIGGFDAVMSSTVPSGSGLSSSASFEILTAQILNVLFNQGHLMPLDLARAGHFAEVEYFNKPCGLMDQMASAIGGMAMMDFAKPSTPKVERVNADFESSGYTLVVTETGGSHASLTDEYTAITDENRAVAKYFGVQVLRDVDEEEFRVALPALRMTVGDRAILRAMHFFMENRRVGAQVEALKRKEYDIFMRLVRESGESSWKLLQNNYLHSQSRIQGIPLALAISEEFLGKEGAWRVHGGGFAGTIQAFVPVERVSEYVLILERVFGGGACRRLRIRPEGASWMPVLRHDPGR